MLDTPNDLMPLYALELKALEFALDDSFLKEYASKRVAWGSVGYVTYKRTYARKKPDGSSEEWWETVRRVVEGTYRIQQRHCQFQGLHWNAAKAQRSAREMFDRIFTFKFTPPGRGLWMMGTEFIRSYGSAPLQNCGFFSTQNIDEEGLSTPMCYLMDLSMLGVGVGFDTRGAGKILVLKPERTDEVFVIPDSREGWVEALRRCLDAWTITGKIPHFDYSEIRGPGEPIKGFGGIAAGPGPLRRLIEEHIPRILGPLDGKLITSEAISDVGNVTGVCVVSGNVRRSAEIVLGAPDDFDFIKIKDPEINSELLHEWRWAANMSILAELGMNYSEPASYTAKNGEPGYAWLENMRRYGRMIDPPNDRDYRVIGCNPCVTGDTLVHTYDGLRRIDSLLGQPAKIVVDGQVYSTTEKGAFKTGRKPVYLLETEEGHRIKVTGNHQMLTAPRVTAKKRYETWVEAQDLEPEDKLILSDQRCWARLKSATTPRSPEDGSREDEGWLIGNLIGDGHFYMKDDVKLQYWGRDAKKMLAAAQRMLGQLFGRQPTTGSYVQDRDMWSVSSRDLRAQAEKLGIDAEKNLDVEVLCTRGQNFIRGFVAGMFDADGSVQGDQEKGVSIRLSSVNMQHLRAVQQMLLTLGVNSTIYGERRKAGVYELPDGRGGMKEYECQDTHELVVSKDNLQVFADLIPLVSEKRQQLQHKLANYKRALNRDRFVATFKSLTYIGEEDVYDLTMEKRAQFKFTAAGFVVHNCVEQSLEDKELCNLVETYPAHHNSLSDYKRTLKFAYLYAKTVTLLPTHHPEINKVMLRNRRIGCSQSGVVQSFQKIGRAEHFNWCDEGYKYVRELDTIYSEWLGIPESIKVTSIKPSGTVSKLCGATSGMHRAPAEYYIQRIRFAANSELLTKLQEAGYPTEPDAYSPDTVCVEFPIKEKNFEQAETDVPAAIQLADAVALQKYWADNQVSCTVKFEQATEGPHIKDLLELFQSGLKGISFLPYTQGEESVYKQPPWQPITKEEYERRAASIRELNVIEASTHEVTDAYCDSDRCEIPSLVK